MAKETRKLHDILQESFSLSEDKAKCLARALAGMLPDQAYMDARDWANYALELANDYLGGSGVEALTADGAEIDTYYYNTVALYVNLGDSYACTVLYDTELAVFRLISVGDWIEEQERRGRYQFT
jgi:hypothetical protein